MNRYDKPYYYALRRVVFTCLLIILVWAGLLIYSIIQHIAVN